MLMSQEGSEGTGRISRWCAALGLEQESRAKFWTASEEATNSVLEYRVIEQDVHRTRADTRYFRAERTRRLMRMALVRYCGFYKVGYMQGLNEILAVLMASIEVSEVEKEDEDEKKGEGVVMNRVEDVATEQHAADDDSDAGKLHLAFALFERIVERLAPVVFATEGVQALQAQLASFHLLLYYFDADLHGFLSKEGMTTDVYAQSWFITLFARRSPMKIAVRVWDRLLELSKPHIVIFLGVALLLHNRQKLAALPTELIPETLVRIQFVSEAEVDDVFRRALELEALIPASAVEEMRRAGFDASLPESERAPGLFELMYRPCLTASAADVAAAIFAPTHPACSSDEPPGKTRQYLLIESRPDGAPPPCLIRGALPIPTSIIQEICRVATAQLSSGKREPNLSFLSPAAAVTLSLLRCCRAPHVHLIICGADPKARAAAVPTTGSDKAAVAASLGEKTPPVKVSSTASVSAQKRYQAKKDNALPHNHLATALLVLGFSHVCVLKGEGLTQAEADAAAVQFPKPLEALAPALRSNTDGFASLVFHLLRSGCECDAGNGGAAVLCPPKDIVLVPPPRPGLTAPAVTDSESRAKSAPAPAEGSAPKASGGGSSWTLGLDLDAMMPKNLFQRISNTFGSSSSSPRPSSSQSPEELRRAVAADSEL